MKLLGVSLAGAEFGEQRLPGRVNFDYVYPTDRETYRYSSGKGFSIVRLPFLWERVQPKPFGPLAREEVAAIRDVLDHACLSEPAGDPRSAQLWPVLPRADAGSPTQPAWPTSGFVSRMSFGAVRHYSATD